LTSGKLDAALQLAARICLAFSHKRLVEATAPKLHVRLQYL